MLINHYFHAELHHAGAAELRAEADTARLANQTRPEQRRAHRSWRRWWRQTLHDLRSTWPVRHIEPPAPPPAAPGKRRHDHHINTPVDVNASTPAPPIPASCRDRR